MCLLEYALGEFYFVEFNYFSGRCNKVIEIFVIDHYSADIGNKNIAGKY